ncbi:serine hydrolase [Eggerthellaceae bacterium zg-887]|uniref:D-alanyl-D-alanine carboxypeptidase family protein n=1 Tax=Xiamenia xianingshaonis TaxID=2682776 RepID=UPI001407EE35|nr:D-alanyl-D-alanine carboxypeptidase family protein [Xiamenia xianingshaonis]NHM16230.1 serine hydrolase [Xiamenia xianingshaonis]
MTTAPHSCRNLGRQAAAYALAALLALSCAIAAPASAAFADVRKADVVYGETVEQRDLAVAAAPSIDAQFALVTDADGTVYFERDATTPAQIASITKVMTAVVVLDAVNEGVISLDTPVVVSEAAAWVGESSAGLAAYDEMDVDTALKALLVPSGNDAAVALAETLGQIYLDNGTYQAESAEAAFVAAMNAKAAELGAVDSVYENPHGLDFDEHAGNLHSCAKDVASLIRYAMQNDVFREDVALGDTTITVTRGGEPTEVYLEATDQFPDYSEYAIGVKTGFTELAGACFSAATNKDGLELYAAVLNSSSEEQRFVDAETLTSWVYDHLKTYPLAHSVQSVTMDGQEVPLIAYVACNAWIDKTVPATLADPDAAIEVFDLNGNVSQSVEFLQPDGTVRAGDKVGVITFSQRNNVVAEMDLVATEDVAAPNFIEGVTIWWERLVRGITGGSQTAENVVVNETPLIVDKTSQSSQSS